MRLQDYYEPGNESKLKGLCDAFLKATNKSTEKGKQPLPKDVIADLKAEGYPLHIDEYSEFLNWWTAGGYKELIDSQIDNDLMNGGEPIDHFM